MKKLLLAGILLSTVAKAESFPNWDHLGTSFALTTISYGVTKTAFKGMGVNDEFGTILFSSMLSLGISSTYTFSGNNTQAQMKNKMWSNILGIGLSDLTTIVFHF